MSESKLVGRALDDRYVILRMLGRGAMGTVFVARQVAIDREVAVKVIRGDTLESSELIARFMREARSASALHHPNVVTVHDFGRTKDGVLYLVMELLDGKPLGTILRDGKIPLVRAISIAIQVCAGLQEAHRRGIVHRDLKPDNIMICRTEGVGEVAKILDFGIAKLLESTDQSVTEAGHICGSPPYISPEQASGHTITAASDLYSLGVVLYQMVAGRLPFSADTSVAMIMHHVKTEPPPIDSVVDEPLPPMLSRLIMKCLEKDPLDRLASAAVLREALAEVIGEQAPNLEAWEPERLEPRTSTHDVRADPDTAKPVDWKRGDIIDKRFRIERTHHHPGCVMAAAVDLSVEGGVNVQLLLADVPDREATEMVIERWFTTLSRFHHEGTVGVLEHGWSGDAVVLVGEALPGTGLDRYLHGHGPIAPTDAIRLVRDVCVTLESLHEVGITHQDLRPRTIRVRADLTPVIAGSALWALVEVGVPVYVEDELRHAARYKAPEQLGAFQSRVGPEIDLYALGVVLYELLTDRIPYEGTNELDLSRAKLTYEPAAPSLLVPGIPKDIDSIVLRLLKPQPVDRYRTAAALRADLEHILSGAAGPLTGTRHAFAHLDAEGVLHGRDVERSRLHSLVTGLERGVGGFVVIRAAPGVGKSRLADEAAFEVRQRNGMVLRTKAREHDVSSPFGGLRSLFAELAVAVDRRDPEDREALLTRMAEKVGEQGAILRPYAPFLDRLFKKSETPPDLAREYERERLMGALCDIPIAVARAEEPLCLVLDDLQWLDDGTREFLEYLVQTVARVPLLVIGCTRPTPEDHPVTKTLDALVKDGAHLIELEGLDRANVERFLAERIGVEQQAVSDIADRFHRLSEGSPAALRTLLNQAEELDAIVRSGTQWVIRDTRLAELKPEASVANRMMARLAALPATTRVPLAAAAAWGAPFDLSTLQALLPDTVREELVAAMIAADRSGLIQPFDRARPTLRDFSHDMLREGARALLVDDDERSLLHRRAADLCAVSTDDPIDRNQRVAEHLLQADLRSDDVDWLRRAAEDSLERWSGDAAVRFAEGALSRLDTEAADPGLLMQLRLLVGKGHILMRDTDKAAVAYERLLLSNPPPEVASESLKQLGEVQFFTGQFEAAIQTLDRAARVQGYRPVRSKIGASSRKLKRFFDEVIRKLPKEFTATTDIDVARRQISEALMLKARSQFFQGNRDDSAVSLLDALHYGRTSRDLLGYVRALSQASMSFVSGPGMIGPATRLSAAAVGAAEVSQNSYAVGLARASRCGLWAAIGKLSEVSDEYDALRDRMSQLGETWTTAIFTHYVVSAFEQQGRLVDASRISAAQADVLITGTNRRWGRSWLRHRAAWIALACGNPDTAEKLVEIEMKDDIASSDQFLMTYMQAVHARVSIARGDFEEARKRTEICLAHAKSYRMRRHASGTTAHLANEYSRALLTATSADRDAWRPVRSLIELGDKVSGVFPLDALHIGLAAARHDLAFGATGRAKRRVRRLATEARAFASAKSLIGGEVLYLLGVLEGGRTTSAGRTLLDEAFEHVSLADPIHEVRRMIAGARETDDVEATGGAAGILAILAHKVESPVLAALTADLAGTRGTGSSSRSSTSASAGRSRTLDLVEQVHARLARVHSGEQSLPSVLAPIVHFAGAEFGSLCRFSWVTEEVEIVATYPEATRLGDDDRSTIERLASAAARTAAPVSEETVLTDEGLKPASLCAVPYRSEGVSPWLVLHLSNRRVSGVFDKDKINALQAVLGALAIAVRIETGEEGGSL